MSYRVVVILLLLNISYSYDQKNIVTNNGSKYNFNTTEHMLTIGAKQYSLEEAGANNAQGLMLFNNRPALYLDSFFNTKYHYIYTLIKKNNNDLIDCLYYIQKSGKTGTTERKVFCDTNKKLPEKINLFTLVEPIDYITAIPYWIDNMLLDEMIFEHRTVDIKQATIGVFSVYYRYDFSKTEVIEPITVIKYQNQEHSIDNVVYIGYSNLESTNALYLDTLTNNNKEVSRLYENDLNKVFSSITVTQNNNPAPYVVRSDYDGDGIDDQIIFYSDNQNQIDITFYLSSIAQEKKYHIESLSNNLQIYRGYTSDELIVEQTNSSNSNIIDIYRWNVDKKTWTLNKEISTSVQYSYLNAQYIPIIHSIKRPNNSFVLGENLVKKSFYEEADLNNIILNELINIEVLLDKKKIGEAIEYINKYTATEYANILNDSNVLLLNNLAYYLAENRNLISSTIILEKIVDQYPTRIVAKLNLADVYWELGSYYENTSKAKILYQDYKNLMIKKGLEKKIPKRVHERLAIDN